MTSIVNPSIERRMPGFLHVLLVLLTFSIFLSETKFIPSIRNNIGMFEMSSLLVMFAVLVYFFRNSLQIYAHPLILLMGLWFVVALLSLVNIHAVTFTLSTVAVIIVLFQFVFTLALFNILTFFPSSLRYLLRYILISATIIGLWVLVEQLADPENYLAVGPFRNRSHAGIYMMSVFWMVLVYRFWPGIATWEKVLSYPALGLIAYTMAASLRQSVYTSMIVGLVGLLFSFVLIRGRERFNLSAIMLLLFSLLAVLFLVGGSYLSSLYLFKRETLSLENRWALVLASSDDPEFEESFDAKQRQGAIHAFFDHPVLGIGWMGFYRSEYSDKGHELHSTPLRFVAELGVFGIAIYVSFLWIVLSGAVRLFLRAKRTPYQLSSYVLMVGLFTQVISHYYNRMFTDRPYWILLVVFLVFEAHLKVYSQETSLAATAVPADDMPVRFRPATTYLIR